jgi:hypothetical protein
VLQLLVGLIATIAMLPFCGLLPNRALRLVVAVGAGLSMALLAAATAGGPEVVPEDRPIEVTQTGYVGSGACRSCHPGEHASWHGSFHRTMTQPCTEKTLRADLGEARRLTLDQHGRTIVLEWRNDRLWAGMDDALRPGPQHRRWHEIVQLTGSHHAQVLWFSSGLQRQLTALPMAYRIAERQWLPIDAMFLMPPHGPSAMPAGMWNENCSSCHATRTQPRVDIDRADTHVAEFGIACESCHGPGAEHVAANRNPLRRYRLRGTDDGDPTVVEPARLDPARSPEVCGQCHSVSILRREHFDDWRAHGSPFRPGEDLHTSKLVVTTADSDAPELRRQLQNDPQFFRNTFWPDGRVRVTGREYNGLLQSPCHDPAAGEQAMTCVSCHEMHPDANDGRSAHEWRRQQLKPQMHGNAACTQCHPEFDDADRRRAHTHHEDNQAGCLDCHMPHTTWGLLKTVRSHAVSSPDLGVELATGRPNACNLCHLDRTTAWTAEHLGAWYATAPVELDDEAREVAAGVRWLLRGDAAQRAIVADATRRESTRRASGEAWLQPYLGQLLADPYYAVRFVARRSLLSIGVTVPAGYDHLGPTTQAQRAAQTIRDAFRAESPEPTLLLAPDGRIDLARFQRLLARRDDRPIVLAE